MRGNPGRRPIRHEVEPFRGNIDCPKWLDSTARKEWERVAPELERLELLTQIDVMALAAYCVAFADLMSARAMIKQKGRYLTGSRGSTIVAPWVRQANKASEMMVRHAAQFGCTPSARRGLEVKPMKSKGKSEIDRILDE